MTDNEYFIFTHQTHATMWSVEETTIKPERMRADSIWLYFLSPDGKTVYAVRRELHQTEGNAYSYAYRSASLNIEMGNTATIHHMTDPHGLEQIY